MKKIQINTKSWHYRFVQRIGVGNRYPENLCDYIGTFMQCTLLVSIVSAIAGFVLWVLADFLAWLIVGIIYGFVEPGVLAGVVLILLGLAAIVGILEVICKGTQKSFSVVSNTELSKAVFSSIKDKVCYQVEFK